jgi:hypothetical protein
VANVGVNGNARVRRRSRSFHAAKLQSVPRPLVPQNTSAATGAAAAGETFMPSKERTQLLMDAFLLSL